MVEVLWNIALAMTVISTLIFVLVVVSAIAITIGETLANYLDFRLKQKLEKTQIKKDKE